MRRVRRLAWHLWLHSLEHAIRALDALQDRSENDRVPESVAGWVACPDCGMELPIGIAPLQLGIGEDGEQVAIADLQMDDLWAHAWTHGTDKEPL